MGFSIVSCRPVATLTLPLTFVAEARSGDGQRDQATFPVGKWLVILSNVFVREDMNSLL